MQPARIPAYRLFEGLLRNLKRGGKPVTALSVGPHSAAWDPASTFIAHKLGSKDRLLVLDIALEDGFRIQSRPDGAKPPNANRGYPRGSIRTAASYAKDLEKLRKAGLSLMGRGADGNPLGNAVHPIAGDALQMPLKKQSVDLVVSHASAHFMHEDAGLVAEYLIPEVLRVLRKGGKAVIMLSDSIPVQKREKLQAGLLQWLSKAVGVRHKVEEIDDSYFFRAGEYDVANIANALAVRSLAGRIEHKEGGYFQSLDAKSTHPCGRAIVITKN